MGVCALALAAMLAAAPAARADEALSFGGALSAGYDSNVANAEASADVRDAALVSAGADATYRKELSLYTAIVARGSLEGEYDDRYAGLSNGKATGLLRVMFRPGGDFYTPLWSAWVSAAYWEFDSAIRDSNEYRGGVFMVEQLTTQVRSRLSLAGVVRDSASRVFDTRGASAALDLDWMAAPRTTVYAGYQFYQGDVVSTSSPSVKIGLAAKAIEADDAFGGFSTDALAYRLGAHAHIGTLGVNYALSSHLSADLQGTYVDTRADYRNHYEREITVLSLLARF